MVKLYTTHCPKCQVIEKKLRQFGIEFETCEDVEVMKEKGLTAAPALEIEGELKNFKEAVEWLRDRGEEN